MNFPFTKKQKEIDYVLLSYFGVLLVFGLIMLASASAVIGYDRFGDQYFFIKRQLLYGAIPGVLAVFFLIKIPYTWIKKITWFIAIGSFALLVLVLIPGIGSSFNTGARSWITFGGFSFQPAELAKLGVVFFLATYLAKLGKSVTELKTGFLPALCLGLVPVGLVILQPDIGTASILFVLVFGLLFVSGAKRSHLGVLALLAVAAFFVLILIAPYRAARFTTFLHPELDPQGIGYHINQAYLAIGSGGWFGKGLGHSVQKFQYLPEVHADSIFAVMAEEMGFVVSLLLVVLLLAITIRCIRIAQAAPDNFGILIVSGIVIWFITQSFFNIGAMLGLMPITGVPLPFVSHGGTALVISLIGVGVVLNVSKQR
ncbi:MAG: putative lipid II flippase FtsW [Candidatus Magasanikbacteria bacterium]|nr:putative lipid II flippase FtsW [Candidatus Magasanikbacteria bacterium]|tara:strand:- start:4951 stop:6063 length:1113 start_codon:yes stop_codon:yes gene_type:complete